MANLEQSGSRIPEASSVKLTFSLTVTFYLTKTNVSNTALTLLPKSCFLEKNVDISKIKRTLVLKFIFSRTTCVYLRIKFQVSNLTIFRKECRGRGCNFTLLPPTTSKQTPKGPSRLGSISPILSSKTMRILRWNDVLLFNFTLLSTIIISLNKTPLKSFKSYFDLPYFYM